MFVRSQFEKDFSGLWADLCTYVSCQAFKKPALIRIHLKFASLNRHFNLSIICNLFFSFWSGHPNIHWLGNCHACDYGEKLCWKHSHCSSDSTSFVHISANAFLICKLSSKYLINWCFPKVCFLKNILHKKTAFPYSCELIRPFLQFFGLINFFKF